MHAFQVVMYKCLNVKPLNKFMYFYTKVYDLINTYAHHGKISCARKMDINIFFNSDY